MEIGLAAADQNLRNIAFDAQGFGEILHGRIIFLLVKKKDSSVVQRLPKERLKPDRLIQISARPFRVLQTFLERPAICVRGCECGIRPDRFIEVMKRLLEMPLSLMKVGAVDDFEKVLELGGVPENRVPLVEELKVPVAIQHVP